MTLNAFLPFAPVPVLHTRSFANPDAASALASSNSCVFSSTTFFQPTTSKRALLSASAESTPPPNQDKKPEENDRGKLPVPQEPFLLRLSATIRHVLSAFTSNSGRDEKALPTSPVSDDGREDRRKREKRNKKQLESQVVARRQSATSSRGRSSQYSSQYVDTSSTYSDYVGDVHKRSKDEKPPTQLPNLSMDDSYPEDASVDESIPTHRFEKAPTKDLDVTSTTGVEGNKDEDLDVVYAGAVEHRFSHVWGGYEGGPPPQPPVFDTADPPWDSGGCDTDGGSHEDGFTDAHDDAGKEGSWFDGWFDSGSHHSSDGGSHDGGSHDGGGHF